MVERVLRWLLTVAAIASAVAIFVLTAQTVEQTSALSSSVSSAVGAAANHVTSAKAAVVPASPLPVAFGADGLAIHPLHLTLSVRKLAHTAEFLAFGLFTTLAAGMWARRGMGAHMAGRPRFALLSLAICVAYSLFDQTHKLFVPGREFDVTDLPLDAIGYLAGIGVSLIALRLAWWRRAPGFVGREARNSRTEACPPACRTPRRRACRAGSSWCPWCRGTR